MSSQKQSLSARYAVLSIRDTQSEQNTDLENGLSSIEVEYRQRLTGPNELITEEEETLLSKFIDQFKNPLIALLFGSAFISVLLGSYDDAISITLVGLFYIF